MPSGPFGINVVRVGRSTILFWCLFFLNQPIFPIAREDGLRLILCAVKGLPLTSCFLKGLSLTYSIHASLLMLTTPILIVFHSCLVAKEKAGPSKIAGLLLELPGAGSGILAKDTKVMATTCCSGIS